jgi:hypothetical protein
MGRVDDDFEIVVQFLADVASQFRRDDPFWIGVEANHAKVDIVLIIENTNYGFLGRRLPFKRLSLQKIGYGAGRLPLAVVQCSVKSWPPFNASCFRASTWFLGSGLTFVSLTSRLLLAM